MPMVCITSGKAINKLGISVQMSVSKLCCPHTMLPSTLKLKVVLLKNYFKAFLEILK